MTDEKMYTLREVEYYTGWSEKTLRNYMKSGKLATVRRGNKYYVSEIALQQLPRRKVEATSPAASATLDAEKARDLAARVEGYTRQYDRKEIDVEQYARAILAATGIVFSYGSSDVRTINVG